MKNIISKSSGAFFCASFESDSRKKQHVFEPVLDESDHPVRGLWKRGDKFYARLNLRDSVGQSKQRRIPLSSQSVIQAKAELERLKTERHSPKTKKRKTSPLFSEYWPQYLAEVSGISPRALLSRLQQSGLDSLPGGGAEILDDDVRDLICYGKESSDEYISIHRDAHSIGMPTNCTMLFGTIETAPQRISHLCRLRELQDETNGFQCFVPYPYLPDNSRLPEAQLASANEVLRMISVSRLMLDNIPHIKAYRMNIGDRLSELSLHHGADDFDGTVGHEEIMHEAGSNSIYAYSRSELSKFIVDAKGMPVQRNSIYTKFRPFQDDDDDSSRISLPLVTGTGD